MEEGERTEIVGGNDQEGSRNLPRGMESTRYSRKKQIIAAFCATLTCILNGCVIGYTGPTLPALLMSSKTIYSGDIRINWQQASWITSILSFGCFVGCLAAGPFMEKLGRKKTLVWGSLTTYILGFAFIFLAPSAEVIYVGRFLNGVAYGVVLSAVSVYIVEIATIDMRGFLGCFVQFQGSFGVLLTFCIGSVLTWWQLALAHFVASVSTLPALCIIPESPRWLIMKGNEWQAEVALKWLRGRNPQSLDSEIEQMKKEIAIRKRERISINLLLKPETAKPFLVCMMMMLFLQLTGFNVVVFYCETIFMVSGSSVNPNIASIIVGAVLLGSCFISLGVVSQLGRKVMLVVSMLGMGICQFVLGGCLHMNTYPLYQQNNLTLHQTNMTGTTAASDVSSALSMGEEAPSNPVGFLPVLAMVGFLFMGNVGYGTLIWVVTAELLPPKVRSVANSVIICFAFVTGFFVAKTFADLKDSIGYDGTFFLYGGIAILGAIMTFIFVPETRNKSFEEIQMHFRPNRTKVPLDEPQRMQPLETVS
eukprot:TRINITY_DN4453_c0_g1_i1.p1 TRINITY_DN4453_c0_g1~~TRINITY_DN4453_c0_g1_i1.p1  ORF type:complete len:535 (+),score=63.50 TRINITY_DN4453_c0_g1_i1:43-1647(+)